MYVNSIKESPDNIYYNISIGTDPAHNTARSSYEAYKTQPVLSKADDYYVSVVRFTIPLASLPLYIMPIETTVGNILQTPMKIGIHDFVTNTDYSTKLQYQPDTSGVGHSVPVVQNGSIYPIVTEFHHCYNYSTVVNMFNTALAAVFALFIADHPAYPKSAQPCPFFVYDAETELISLIAHSSWAWGPNTLPLTGGPPNLGNPNTQVIHINFASIKYLDSMQLKAYAIPDGGYALKIYNNGSNSYPTNNFPAAPTYLRMIQESSGVYAWSSLQKILLTTKSIPIVGEQIQVSGDHNPDQVNALSVLSDFVPQGIQAGENRELAFYNPSAQYRLTDLCSSAPLNKISLQLFWQDKNNNVFPLYVQFGQVAEIKLAFLKKSLYKKV